MISKKNYKWYAIAGVLFVGLAHSFIYPIHWQVVTAEMSIMSALVLIAASVVTVLAIINTKSVLGKIAFGLLQLCYTAVLVEIIWTSF